MTGTDLAGWLLERIAEDEAVAQRIHHDYQHVLGIPHYFEPVPRGGMVGLTPRAALAECEAKRRIIALHRREWTALAPSERAEDALDAVLLYLAQPYRDHPSFDASWSLP